LESAGASPLAYRGVADPLEIRYSPTYPADLPENLLLASRLSRLLKVIGTDTDRSTAQDFLLMFRSNQKPISYRFRDKRRFQSKIAKFPTPCILRRLRRGSQFPLELVPALRVKTVMELSGRERSLTISSAVYTLDTIHEDRQTDGHRATAKTALTHSVAR